MSLKGATHLEMIQKIQLGELPDINEGFHRILGSPLTPSEMSNISALVDYDFMAGKAHWKFVFYYGGELHVVLRAFTTDEDEMRIAGISSLWMEDMNNNSFKKFDYDQGDEYTNPFEEVSSLARTAGHSARRENYSREQPYRNPYGGRRTQSHKIYYDAKSESIRCSCLESDKHIWCKVIMDYVTKATDVSVVQSVLDKIGAVNGRVDAGGVIKVPVMPRALLPITVRRVPSLDQVDNAEVKFDYRFEIGDEITLWHNQGEGLRGIVSEFFAYLNRSEYAKTWKGEVKRVRTLIDENIVTPKGQACPSPHHRIEDERLFRTMVRERINESNPDEERKNLLYLATLNAMHSFVHGKCYACHIAWDPKNDVPVL